MNGEHISVYDRALREIHTTNGFHRRIYMATGTVNLTTGKVIGSIILNSPFEFIVTSPAPEDIQIAGEDEEGSPLEWFHTSPATIPKGSTSVTVTAIEACSEEDPFFTYGLTGMEGPENVHIVVSTD
jgi:hypothetical protein